MTPGILIVSILFMLIGMGVQYRLKSKFQTYGAIPTSSGLTGKAIAEKMLRDSGIHNVEVVSVDGFLSDHYDPTNKTINLSSAVYSGHSVAAAAVAAHECGHAVQHANAYSMLMLRSKMAPLTRISTTLSQWVIIAGLGILGFGGGSQTVLLFGIVLFAVSTLFSLITLPVEFDASTRALRWLERAKIAQPAEQAQAKDALNWAAMTYVVAALASIATLVQYVMIYMSRSRQQ